MTQHEGDEYISAEEASIELNVSLRTFLRYAAEQKLPRYRRPVGRRQVFYRRADIEQLKTLHLVSEDEPEGND